MRGTIITFRNIPFEDVAAIPNFEFQFISPYYLFNTCTYSFVKLTHILVSKWMKYFYSNIVTMVGRDKKRLPKAISLLNSLFCLLLLSNCQKNIAEEVNTKYSHVQPIKQCFQRNGLRKNSIKYFILFFIAALFFCM